ncbi:hypothetical protein [Microvirga subterranea]|uniref:hypothetical protein n=1 Tax=Microvirga subterranea TaxID=186651 RepID=UPI0011C050A5|nr:hypothetical protein [Microvirga subterranea]
MSSTRRFLLAPSLARLIEKERGARRLTDGFFPERSNRSAFVRVGDVVGSLILVEGNTHDAAQYAAAIPAAHAFALLECTAGRAEYRETELKLGDLTARIHRFANPGPLDFVAIDFDADDNMHAFDPPPWFGPEVTAAPEYQPRNLVFDGLPEAREVEITNAALTSLLDLLDGASAARQASLVAPRSQKPRLPSADAAQAGVDEGDGKENVIEDDVIRELARSLRPQPRR